MSARVTVTVNMEPIAVSFVPSGWSSTINITGRDILDKLQRPGWAPRQLAEADLIQVVVHSEMPADSETSG